MSNHFFQFHHPLQSFQRSLSLKSKSFNVSFYSHIGLASECIPGAGLMTTVTVSLPSMLIVAILLSIMLTKHNSTQNSGHRMVNSSYCTWAGIVLIAGNLVGGVHWTRNNIANRGIITIGEAHQKYQREKGWDVPDRIAKNPVVNMNSRCSCHPREEVAVLLGVETSTIVVDCVLQKTYRTVPPNAGLTISRTEVGPPVNMHRQHADRLIPRSLCTNSYVGQTNSDWSKFSPGGLTN